MFTATVRGMLAHKLRLALTTASIALGVAFLAGTLILTDTMKLAFEQLFGKVSAGTDAVVRQEAAFDQASGVGLSRGPIDAAVLDKVRAVDGVRAAEGSISGYALLTDTEGKAVTTAGGAPTMGYNLPADKELRGETVLLSGHAPHGRHEVAIDASSAEDHDIALGSTIKVLFRGPTEEFTVVGTVGFGDSKDLGGSTGAYFDTATAAAVLGQPTTYDSIGVSAADGVSDKVLTERLDTVLPDGTEAVTGAAVAKESSDAVNEDLTFVTIMFGIFAAIALFVGSFIIWNTFTMIVSQRSREIALLRAVGATRRQVMRNLVTEAFLLGAFASAVGLGLGVAVAKGLTYLMDAVGFSLPSTATQIEPRTVVVSLVVGTLVTVVASLVPARRATKVLPVEALREATPGSRPPSRTRVVIGTLLGGAGLAGILTGLYAESGAGGRLAMFGILGVVSAVMTLAPLAARPLAAAIGAPLRFRGLPGDLARQNAMRNPRRTASTAAALMIGLTLVVSMGVFASSLKASFSGILGDSTNADLYLTTASAQAEGYSPEASKAAAAVPGVALVSPTGFGEARIAGATTFYSSVDPATAEAALDLDVSSGSASDLGSDGVLVKKKVARAHGWQVGDTVPAEFAETGKQSLRVVGIYDRTGGFIESDFVLGMAAQEAFAGERLDANAIVMLDKGADLTEVKDRIAAALADHPDAQVLDQEEFEEVASGFIDQLLTFVSVMLLLAVLIALLGIVNTLALSVYERTRELGLLRAVGATRGQVRAMVRWESVVISLIGALTGAVLGTGIGVTLAQALKDEGITAISVPFPQIALYVALAAVAGILAAVGPARSAARVDVLKAVVTD
jgi:putative ABC transport system permease protein